MHNEKQVYVSPGVSLALICLKHWLRSVPRGWYPSFAEVDQLSRALTHMIDRLYLNGKPTTEDLEHTIVDAVYWVCWPNLGPFEFDGHVLFNLSSRREAILGALLGGCDIQSPVRDQLHEVMARGKV